MNIKSVILIGVGEVGGVFARAFLREGLTVVPVNRETSIEKVSETHPDPACVVIGVGEKDYKSVMQQIPDKWHDKLLLIQNELLPQDWVSLGVSHPTVISVWFEKKMPSDYKVIIPSPIYGPRAELVSQSLAKMNISTLILGSDEDLLTQLVLKNLYILTTNICGLKVGGNVGELWAKHQTFARQVANEIMDVQFALIGKELNRNSLIEDMVAAFNGDLDHKCMGRSAPARLERILAQAEQLGVRVDELKNI